MKHLIVLALASLASANAFALPKTSPIIRMDLDPQAVGGAVRYNSGGIMVNTSTREARLFLSFQCPPGKMCPAVMVRPFVVTLELVSRNTNRCGAVIYTAETPRTALSRLREKLVIVDNESNHCATQRRQSPVEATYETSGYMGDRYVNTLSTFEGDSFISPMY